MSEKYFYDEADEILDKNSKREPGTGDDPKIGETYGRLRAHGRHVPWEKQRKERRSRLLEDMIRGGKKRKAAAPENEIKIPRALWKKAGTYAKIMCNLTDGAECSGYFLADIDDFSGIATDIAYARGRETGVCHTMSGMDIVENPRTGKFQKIVGVWHNHPGLSTEPSDYDWAWLDRMYRLYAKNHNRLGADEKRTRLNRKAYYDSSRGVIKLVAGYDAPVIELGLDGLEPDLAERVAESLNRGGVYEKETIGPGFFYNLILNRDSCKKEDPLEGADYSCIAAFGSLEDDSYRKVKTTIEIVDDPVDVEIDEMEMLEEMLEHTIFDGKILREKISRRKLEDEVERIMKDHSKGPEDPYIRLSGLQDDTREESEGFPEAAANTKDAGISEKRSRIRTQQYSGSGGSAIIGCPEMPDAAPEDLSDSSGSIDARILKLEADLRSLEDSFMKMQESYTSEISRIRDDYDSELSSLQKRVESLSKDGNGLRKASAGAGFFGALKGYLGRAFRTKALALGAAAALGASVILGPDLSSISSGPAKYAAKKETVYHVGNDISGGFGSPDAKAGYPLTDYRITNGGTSADKIRIDELSGVEVKGDMDGDYMVYMKARKGSHGFEVDLPDEGVGACYELRLYDGAGNTVYKAVTDKGSITLPGYAKGLMRASLSRVRKADDGSFVRDQSFRNLFISAGS